MKKKVMYFIIIGMLCSCSIFKKSNTSNTNDKLIGLWTEHWDKDTLNSKNDVNYVDTLKIDNAGNGKIKIMCINNANYVYSDIEYINDKLSFQMENKVDPKERFLIQYSLIRTESSQFIGEILNSRGEQAKVKLKKR